MADQVEGVDFVALARQSPNGVLVVVLRCCRDQILDFLLCTCPTHRHGWLLGGGLLIFCHDALLADGDLPHAATRDSIQVSNEFSRKPIERAPKLTGFGNVGSKYLDLGFIFSYKFDRLQPTFTAAGLILKMLVILFNSVA